MARPSLSVSFHNFYKIFEPKSSFIVRALSTRYELRIEPAGRDLQFSNVFGREPLPVIPGVRPLRIWWTSEPQDPHGTIFDLHFGFQPKTVLGRRWIRFPLWIIFIDWWDPSATNAVARIFGPRGLTARPHFCSFIYTNTPSIRTEFFLRLNERRPVESLGGYMNNRGRRLDGREALLAAIGESRFNIAFENRVMPGYVTEKLVDPLMMGAIPIYWGAREATSDFNPASFIYANDFDNLDDLVAHVLRLADSEDALAEIAAAPAFRDNRIAPEHTPDFFVDKIAEALSGDPTAYVPERWNMSAALAAGRPRRGSAA
jgi:alpha(1,3/1,4) fucosyltransferase